MELRRALLLFAIVLGLAAVVTVLAGGSRDPQERTEPAPAVQPAPSTPTASSGPTVGDPKPLRFAAAGPPTARATTVGEAAIVYVSADEPGDAELRGLGLLAAVEPTAPARFDVLPDTPGRYRVTFVPSGETTARTVGTFVVRASKK